MILNSRAWDKNVGVSTSVEVDKYSVEKIPVINERPCEA